MVPDSRRSQGNGTGPEPPRSTLATRSGPESGATELHPATTKRSAPTPNKRHDLRFIVFLLLALMSESSISGESTRQVAYLRQIIIQPTKSGCFNAAYLAQFTKPSWIIHAGAGRIFYGRSEERR